MQKIFRNCLAATALATAAVSAAPVGAVEPNQQTIDESRQIAKAFVQSLGSTLKQQLEAGGAESAIGVCKHVAPALAADYSKDGRVVTRVSLKNRNKTLGKPDAWERGILQDFDRQNKQDGAVPEASEITEDAEGRWFRYMKAIPTQSMCLQCHGQPDDISPEVKAQLLKEYPGDSATGYRVGDIRGAVSIKQLLPPASN